MRRLLTFVLVLAPQVAWAGPPRMAMNRTYDVLKRPGNLAKTLRVAARKLGKQKLEIAGIDIAAKDLIAIADGSQHDSILRVSRERLRLALDLEDFIFFLDDVLLARRRSRRFRRRTVFVPGDRARRIGILVHPLDVFREDRARVYGEEGGYVVIDAPPSQAKLRPAKKGTVIGPRWAARYQQPQREDQRLRELTSLNQDFGERIAFLIRQLQNQGASVKIESAVRDRRRGLLIFGSYWLSRAKNARQLRARVRRLRRYNREWDLNIPIRWKHPRGFRRTRESARALAATYGVDYATVGGARRSDHYDGRAIDFIATGLPRRLTLRAPDGESATFDLSIPTNPRDLSLLPNVIEWIEEHFGLSKIRTDYPHWGDDSEAIAAASPSEP